MKIMNTKINSKLVELKLKNYLDMFLKERHTKEDFINFIKYVNQIKKNKELLNNKSISTIIQKTNKAIEQLKIKNAEKNKEYKITRAKMDKLAEHRQKVLKKHFKPK